ncbi:MAG: NUDIX domain-containing protein [Muribaculaceae bacterium]
MSNTELFPIVDPQGNVIGKATRGECHSGSMLLHPVVHLHIFDTKGRLYLQKRSLNKDIQPGKWDTAVGGHVDLGETINQALLRETREELSFTDFQPIPLFTYVFQSSRERELINAFYTVTSQQSFSYDPVEVDDGRFWTIQEIENAIGKDILTPNFESEYAKIRATLPLAPHIK